ncbi:MAG: tRNA (adenosine(37)-N6)-threonylcarbamoyltransferase complex dimerization subunit type 1 TsaB [Crocinitomicaceae bacterium]|nr:tRNA (adenosine(37)-N6)-threonylcarbamoyltransferase complex dimerization subunit type 1 TsaB [Crocinitomicaceae bacterium]
MTFILHIETATKTCSTAISKNGVLIDIIEEHPENYIHSEKLTSNIQELTKRNQIAFKQLSAVSFSSGPGSYTGLRIGSSTAKGICYALNIPLISIPTLQVYDICARKMGVRGNVCSMIDARRMEVYSCISNGIDVLKQTSPDVLDEDSYLRFDPLTVVGDGAFKVKNIWSHRKIAFLFDVTLSSKYQVELAYKKFNNQDFENLALFEPNYYKEFQTTQAKNSKK